MVYYHVYHVFLSPPKAVKEISQLLNTGLDDETLRVCVQLLEAGVNPEALATVVQELRRETGKDQVREQRSTPIHTPTPPPTHTHTQNGGEKTR